MAENIKTVADAITKAVEDSTLVVVHHQDIEQHAKSFNEGFAEACEQFESLLAEAREDLVLEGPAVDLMGYLADAIKAMGAGG